MTTANRALFLYAIDCALDALVSHARRFGRGWYHLADGDMITATEIAL